MNPERERESPEAMAAFNSTLIHTLANFPKHFPQGNPRQHFEVRSTLSGRGKFVWTGQTLIDP